ncbi:hypothetical protein [Alloyangia pacifica]|uniref:hypothetical protein n=1 Tax=Alloyangia pacifica TaxID=311180 RepID=UPI001CD2A89B|nr:hypothetical protein [Alloyangia pacifica]MCA0995408.1 hypothetical protein [Alloyangia pacifica]
MIRGILHLFRGTGKSLRHAGKMPAVQRETGGIAGRSARFCVAALVWLLATQTAEAQQVILRSGTHDGFTRLVLDVPENFVWQGGLAPQENVFRVDFDRPGYDIDFSRVFDRIDRARVAAVGVLPGGAGVEISLACDCVVETSEHDGRMIVLDIFPRAERAPDGTDDPQVVQAPPEPPPAGGSRRRSIDLGLLPGIVRDSRVPSLLPRFDPENRGGPAVAGPPDPAELEIAEAFGQALLEQLSQGATQGLLVPNGPSVRPQASAHEGPGKEQIKEAAAHGAPPPAPGFSAEMISGTPAQGFGASSVLRIGGQSACIPDARLDLPGWFGSGGEADALQRMGQLRGRLMGEFDRIDRRAQTDLAQVYISLGFGAEARALLQLDDTLPDPVLMTLATLSEGGSDPAGVFAGQSECRGRAALWALLGARALPENAELSEAAVLRSFEELPQSLRRALGPKLAERFAEEGHLDAGRNVLSRLGRAIGRVTEEMQLAAARIARLSGEPEEAEDLFAALLSAPGELGVAAAVESIDLATEEGHPIDAGLVDLTAAYSTERRATDQREAVWLAHVRAAWANGEYDRAFAEIDHAEDIAAETLLRARDEALRALNESAGDGKFLRRALEPENLALAPAFPRTAAQIAGRLLNLGLPAEAGRWLEAPPPPGLERDWRLLAARKALAEHDPEEAEIALVGLQGDDVLRLRAEAREMMGDFDFAKDAYQALRDAENAERLAWLAGDMSAMAAGDDPVLAALAELTGPDAAPGTGDAGAVPSLSRGQELADSGDATAETIRALLAQTALPEL